MLGPITSRTISKHNSRAIDILMHDRRSVKGQESHAALPCPQQTLTYRGGGIRICKLLQPLSEGAPHSRSHQPKGGSTGMPCHPQEIHDIGRSEQIGDLQQLHKRHRTNAGHVDTPTPALKLSECMKGRNKSLHGTQQITCIPSWIFSSASESTLLRNCKQRERKCDSSSKYIPSVSLSEETFANQGGARVKAPRGSWPRNSNWLRCKHKVNFCSFTTILWNPFPSV